MSPDELAGGVMGGKGMEVNGTSRSVEGESGWGWEAGGGACLHHFDLKLNNQALTSRCGITARMMFASPPPSPSVGQSVGQHPCRRSRFDVLACILHDEKGLRCAATAAQIKPRSARCVYVSLV